MVGQSGELRQLRGRFTANDIADAIGGKAPFKDNYALLKKLSEM